MIGIGECLECGIFENVSVFFPDVIRNEFAHEPHELLLPQLRLHIQEHLARAEFLLRIQAVALCGEDVREVESFYPRLFAAHVRHSLCIGADGIAEAVHHVIQKIFHPASDHAAEPLKVSRLLRGGHAAEPAFALRGGVAGMGAVCVHYSPSVASLAPPPDFFRLERWYP